MVVQSLCRNAGSMAIIVLCSLGLASQATAQSSSNDSAPETAKRYDATSPGGVSFPTGSYTYQVGGVSIGQGEFPQALSYNLTYNSGSDKAPNSAWAHNLTVRWSRTIVDDPAAEVPEPDGKPHPEWRTFLYNVVVGQRSAGFENYNWTFDTNPYHPTTLNGETFHYTGTSTSGYHTYTGRNGEAIKFRSIDSTDFKRYADTWTEPDGTTLKFNYSSTYRSIESNRGLAIFFEAPTGGGTTRKICALNLTQYYLPNLTSCPTGAMSVTVVAAGSTDAGFSKPTSITRADGGVYNFTYGGRNNMHLTCVKEPGQSVCSVTNTYDQCDGSGSNYPYEDADPTANGSRDRVTNQVFATGETYSYTYTSLPICRGNSSTVMTNALSAQTTVTTDAQSGVVYGVTNPLGHASSFTYTGENPNAFHTTEATIIASETSPESDKITYVYDKYGDKRGNIWETIRTPKSGSGSITTSAVYPTSCTNPKTCNKPTSTTDANGNTTSYTYDATHGGVLTETGPAVNGVTPQKRYEYAQRYAWIKNASGGYSQAASPVWLLVRDRSCRTTNPSGASCVGGAADEVVTDYDYGPNSGPNNLWLRGVAVTADGTTLRTCYGYDANGRKISETQPNANLGSCP